MKKNNKQQVFAVQCWPRACFSTLYFNFLNTPFLQISRHLFAFIVFQLFPLEMQICFQQAIQIIWKHQMLTHISYHCSCICCLNTGYCACVVVIHCASIILQTSSIRISICANSSKLFVLPRPLDMLGRQKRLIDDFGEMYMYIRKHQHDLFVKCNNTQLGTVN